MFKSSISMLAALAVATIASSRAEDHEDRSPCQDLPTHDQVATALKAVVTAGHNAGFALNMWATIVNRDGVVCTVAFSGTDREQGQDGRVL